MDFIHGIAICKKYIQMSENKEDIEAGEKGIITGYLPEDNKFSIYFILGRWLSFDSTKEEFDELFDVILADENNEEYIKEEFRKLIQKQKDLYDHNKHGDRFYVFT